MRRSVLRIALVAAAGFWALAGRAPAQNILFSENFEGGGLGLYTETNAAGAPAATLWHGESSCDGVTPLAPAMGTRAAAYNQGDIAIYTFNTGGTNAGAIESPVHAASPAGDQVTLLFSYAKETESL